MRISLNYLGLGQALTININVKAQILIDKGIKVIL
jgi:hypothetical protein